MSRETNGVSHAAASKLYEHILRTANFFLNNAKLFEINVLKDHNPSYEELADIMEKVANIVFDAVNDIDPHMAAKAMDYTFFMKKMSIAILDDDQEEFEYLRTELDKMSFL